MKLTVKTITGSQFFVEVTPEETVLQVKQKIESAQGHKAELQKLIHAGKILKDDQTMEAAGVKENSFLVCMVSKAKAAAPAPTAAPSTPAQAPSSAPVSTPPPVTQASSGTTTTPAVRPPSPRRAPAPTPTLATPPTSAAPSSTPSATTASSTTSTTSNAPSGEGLQPDQATITQLMDMGFPEDQVRAALRAAFNNADRAVEYLMNGIPETAPSSSAPTAGSGSGLTAAGGLDMLRRHPQFNALRELVQANPSALPVVLQQIGQQNPDLLQLIHRHQEEFVQLLNEPITQAPAQPSQPAGGAPSPGASSFPGLEAGGGPSPQQMLQMIQSLPAQQQAEVAASMGMSREQLQQLTQMMANMPPEMMQQLMGAHGDALGGAGPGAGAGGPGPVTIQLTQEEAEAINRLTELGFDRGEALQAYLACDKNEALAANFLMDSMGGDAAWESGAPGGAGGNGGSNDDDMYG